MVELTDIIIPIVIGAIVPIGMMLWLRHSQAFDKTTQRTTLATFNVGTMQTEVKRIEDTLGENKDHFDKKVDGLIALIEKKEVERRMDSQKVWDRLETITAFMKVTEYRLDKAERVFTTK